jgi:hypothetical protein
MTLPHPQSRKDHERNEDIPRLEGIGRQLVEWTVDVTEYWNAEDEVNPAENCTAKVSVPVGRIG